MEITLARIHPVQKEQDVGETEINMKEQMIRVKIEHQCIENIRKGTKIVIFLIVYTFSNLYAWVIYIF